MPSNAGFHRAVTLACLALVAVLGTACASIPASDPSAEYREGQFDSADSPDILGCARSELGGRGYLVRSVVDDRRKPGALEARRSRAGGGNVDRVGVVLVQVRPLADTLRRWLQVSAEARTYQSDSPAAGYTLELPAPGDVRQDARETWERCVKHR